MEAERLQRVAAGDEAGTLDDGLDELGLLARAMQRASRCVEQTRIATAEAALLRAELAQERAKAKVAADEQAQMLEAQRVS